MESIPPSTHSGTVETVLVAHQFGNIRSFPVGRLQLQIDTGIFGDSHARTRRISDAREKVLRGVFGLPHGIEIANMRQVSIVSSEELLTISAAMEGCPEPLLHGLLGENIVISGVPQLSKLPAGTMMHFSQEGAKRTAVLWVTGENHPCDGPGKLIQEHFPGAAGLGKRFVAAARGRRGVVAIVYVSGFIKPGDTVKVYVPEQRIYQPK